MVDDSLTDDSVKSTVECVSNEEKTFGVHSPCAGSKGSLSSKYGKNDPLHC